MPATSQTKALTSNPQLAGWKGEQESASATVLTSPSQPKTYLGLAPIIFPVLSTDMNDIYLLV